MAIEITSESTIMVGTQEWVITVIDGLTYYGTGKGRRALTVLNNRGEWEVIAGFSTFMRFDTIEQAAASRKPLASLPIVVEMVAETA